MLIVTVIIAVLCFGANLADVLTTYEGVYVKKVASEASSANAWFSDSPAKLLTIKPLAIAFMCAMFCAGAAYRVLPIAILGGAIMIASGVIALLSALRNAKINAATPATK